VTHLSVFSLGDSKENLDMIKERLNLAVAALNLISEVWPMAHTVKAQISRYAREVIFSPTAGQAQAESQFNQMINASSMIDQTWLDGLFESGHVTPPTQ